MKVKYFAALAAASVFGVTALTSCTPETEVVVPTTEDIEGAADKAVDEIEGAADKAADKIDEAATDAKETIDPCAAEADPCAADPCAAE